MTPSTSATADGELCRPPAPSHHRRPEPQRWGAINAPAVKREAKRIGANYAPCPEVRTCRARTEPYQSTGSQLAREPKHRWPEAVRSRTNARGAATPSGPILRGRLRGSRPGETRSGAWTAWLSAAFWARAATPVAGIFELHDVRAVILRADDHDAVFGDWCCTFCCLSKAPRRCFSKARRLSCKPRRTDSAGAVERPLCRASSTALRCRAMRSLYSETSRSARANWSCASSPDYAQGMRYM